MWPILHPGSSTPSPCHDVLVPRDPPVTRVGSGSSAGLCRRTGGRDAQGVVVADLPLEAITPDRRISRARRQLIRSLLIRSTADVGVGTHSAPRVCGVCNVCPPQVPDMCPAPFHEVAYIWDTTVQRQDLVTRICRCHTCIRHSLWACQRYATSSVHAAGSFPFLELVHLPLSGIQESSPDDRNSLRREHLRRPASAVFLCGCFRRISHQTLDYVAEALTHMERSEPAPPEGGGCRDPRLSGHLP